MSSNPLLLVIVGLASLYLGKLWLDDVRAAEAGKPAPRPLPGATRAHRGAILIAVIGALVLLAIETFGEHALGISAEQSTITWLFAIYTLAAPIIEEIMFRGFLVIDHRGPAVRWAGILVASAIFALIHAHLFDWGDEGFALTLTSKGFFTTGILFATSVWLYYARFASWNPSRSLLPCIAAHVAKNAGVVVIKASTGFIAGAW
jgi:CAAX amino terminal protease family.